MRKVFFCFDWADFWRANRVRRGWAGKDRYETSGFLDKTEIERVAKSPSDDIKKWVKTQLEGTSVTCVLLGDRTHERKWVRYEISQSVKQGNGLLGVRIHCIKDEKGGAATTDSNAAPAYRVNPEDDFPDFLGERKVVYGLNKLLLPRMLVSVGVLTNALVNLESSEDDYRIYDWEEDEGYRNLGEWIETAASQLRK